MDSPKPTTITSTTASTTTTTTTATLSGSPPVQESPFSNFASNLSPIEPVRAPHTVQELLGLNSPPLVFTSPSINTARETNFLKRLRHPQPSNGETPEHDDSINKISDVPGDMEKSVNRLGGQLVINALHNGARNSEQVQPRSPSGCVDEYLADPVDVDCTNSAYSSCLSLKQTNKASQSSLNSSTGLKKLTLKSDNKDNLWMKINAPLDLSDEAQEHYQEKSVTGVKSVRNDNDEQRSGHWPSTECPNTDADLSVDHATKTQQCSSLDAENAGGGQQDEYHCSPHLQGRPLQIIWPHDDCGVDIKEISHGTLAERTHDQASQNQRGVSRRCLQFEECQLGTLVKSTSSSNLANNGNADFESLNSSNADLSTTARDRELVNLSQPLTPVFLAHHSGKSSLPASKPLGIGLHLNSIVNTVAVGHGATPNMKLAKDHMTNASNMRCSKLSYSDGKVSISAEGGISETKSTIAASSSASGSFQTMENATPYNKRMFNSDNIEDSDQLSPKKKRKKSSSADDGDGCKRCNCKKTKCLKLYCDCFAAGVYCAESCACQVCFNKPEYEDTVQETKQQIESRNPMAFAPKIVHCITEFQANSEEHGDRFTPSSARHKRGCNCKRSKCLKKYCECYQANVGCSDGCRCEGCKNVFGRKEEYIMTEEMVSNSTSENRFEGTFDERMQMVAAKKVLLQAETCESHNLTPLTPSFLCSDHGKDASKSRFISRRYLPSPECDLTILSSVKSPRSPKNSDKNEIVETNKEISDTGSYIQSVDNDTLDTEQILPRFGALADTHHPALVPNPPSVAIGSSVSSKTKGRKSVSLIQLGPGSCRLSSGGSLRWRSSPVTPVTRLGGTKNLEGLESESGLCDILEDDTPEMLKETSTPTKSVKVNSPNRKRISPPHSQVQELGSSSSGGVKSSRRFILKAVAFPPLTPCIDSKGSSCQSGSKLQEKSSDK